MEISLSLLQSCPLPSVSSFRLLDFSFDDASICDQDTLLSTLAMVIDLKLHEHFNVDYQVNICCGFKFVCLYCMLGAKEPIPC